VHRPRRDAAPGCAPAATSAPAAADDEEAGGGADDGSDAVEVIGTGRGPS